MSRRVMTIALARAMNASITRVRCSVQMWSFLKPWLCHKFILSTTYRVPVCSGVPFVLITQSQPNVDNSSLVFPES